jgi:molybdopterin molybdotransferase
MALLPVEEALARILKDVKPVAAEAVPLAEAPGRVLAEPLKTRRDQPPFAASAMDGYAVRTANVAQAPVRLKTIGMAAAGHAFTGSVKEGQAVRIFTGAPLPRGADTVVIQENATAETGFVTINQTARLAQNVRNRGLDFKAGETLLSPGICLNARDIGLAAAMNCAPSEYGEAALVAVIATGELVLPGARADQIFSSNSHALAAMAEHFGAKVLNLGIVADSLKATERAIAKAAAADILVTSGGASVGDHDFVQEALKRSGVRLDFWKIAMRPGKPFMYGRRGRQRVMGLPGNPVSALVCARLFLKPLLDALLGLAGQRSRSWRGWARP